MYSMFTRGIYELTHVSEYMSKLFALQETQTDFSATALKARTTTDNV